MVLVTMDHQEYIWSETEYAIRDFIELYGKRLPQIVEVRHCFMGSDNRLQTTEHGKVILVYAIDKQRRLVATERNNRHVSIPLNHPLKVHIFIDGKIKQSKSVSSVERLLKKKSTFNFMFETDQNLPAHLRAGSEANLNIGPLNVSSVGEERFVVGHAIREGDVFGMDPTSIPTYVTVKLAVASGLAQGNKKAYQKLLTELFRSAKRRAKDASLNQDIIIFPSNSIYSEQNYVDPMQVIRLSLLENTSRGLFDRRANSVSATSGPASGPPLPPRTLSSSSGHSLPDHGDYFGAPPSPAFQSQMENIPEMAGFPSGKQTVMHNAARDGNYVPMSGVYMELVNTQSVTGEIPDDDEPYRDSDYNASLHGSAISRVFNPHHGSVTSSVSASSTGTGSSSISPCLKQVFKTLDDVPLNFSKLTPIEVNDCLRLLKMSQYLPRFIARCVDGEMVVSLDESILVAEFGFNKFDAIKMMKFSKLGYRPKNCPCAAAEGYAAEGETA